MTPGEMVKIFLPRTSDPRWVVGIVLDEVPEFRSSSAEMSYHRVLADGFLLTVGSQHLVRLLEE